MQINFTVSNYRIIQIQWRQWNWNNCIHCMRITRYLVWCHFDCHIIRKFLCWWTGKNAWMRLADGRSERPSKRSLHRKTGRGTNNWTTTNRTESEHIFIISIIVSNKSMNANEIELSIDSTHTFIIGSAVTRVRAIAVVLLILVF